MRFLFNQKGLLNLSATLIHLILEFSNRSNILVSEPKEI